MIENVIVTHLERALSRNWLRTNKINHRISIVGSTDILFVLAHQERYHIPSRMFVFDDVTQEYEDSTIVCPTEKDIQDILAYLKMLTEAAGKINLVIHCHAGISRSTAVAAMLFRMMYGDDQKAIEKLFEIRSCAHPNGLMLHYADKLMNWNLLKVLGSQARYDKPINTAWGG